MLDFTKDTQGYADLTATDSAMLSSLVTDGVMTKLDADRATFTALRLAVPVADVLLRQYDLNTAVLAQHQARAFSVDMVNPEIYPPDPDLIARLGAAQCLRDGILPWASRDGVTIVLTSRIAEFAGQRAKLEQVFGAVAPAVATESDLILAIETLYAPVLVRTAETCVASSQSCRDWDSARFARIILGTVLLVSAAAFVAPQILILVTMVWAIIALVATTALKLTAALAVLRTPAADPPPVAEADLPVITMLVPLYRETAIASHLLVRLAALRYPRALLDVCLVLEQDDTTTRATLARTRLPGWMRAITVPPGQIKTKPRALNYALPFARGSIIGIWDAEDAPAPDQLHVVARHFAQAAPDVACLQGILDHYNTSANWLTRCFTIEYAAWFRVVLPGIARLGLVVPLGGTTLFFRRNLLEKLGAWDAHNVTEDADLGLRLARHGYKTALIPTVTLEEANGRGWLWVKQRSRWLKGYAITYGVHMRNPAALLRDLGWGRFIGVQVMFLGTLSLFVLIPAFWSLWLVPLGFAHPFRDALHPTAFRAVCGGFLMVEMLALLVNLLGLHKAGKIRFWGWALTLPIYFPLGALAAYRGLAELVTCPFYWDKTVHGKRQVIPPPPPLPRPVSVG